MELSVIIPCYNGESYIAQTIGSLLEQSWPADQIIVVDDGSTDQSAAIARSFGSAVHVISNRCGGASKARNYGYRFATGEALMFLDADDVLGPQALEALMKALSHAPSEIAICPWHRLREVKGTWVKRPPTCRPRHEGEDALGAWLTGWWHPPCSVLWSRTAFKRTGGWDQRAYVNDDGDVMMRALLFGSSLVKATNGSAYYRRLPDERASVSGARSTRKGRDSQLYVIRKVARLLEARGQASAYREELRDAFQTIGAACGDAYPDLRARCFHYADRYGDARWKRQARRLVKKGGRSVKRPLAQGWRGLIHTVESEKRSAGEDSSNNQNHVSREIRYGLTAAKQVLASEGPAPASEPAAAPGGHTAVSGRAWPAVTVVIPTYNRAHTVPRAIDSVLAQTYQDLELIVVDDGSTDDTAARVSRYEDSRVRYLQQPENRGVSAARNRGMREAKGEFIAFLDSDDTWFPKKLEKQIGHFQNASEEVGLVYAGVESIWDDGSTWCFRPKHRGDLYLHLLRTNPLHAGASSVVIRRSVIRTIGFFDESIPAIEDYDYWIRVSRYYEIDYVDELLSRYYDNLDADRRSREAVANLEARHILYEKHGNDMRRAGVAHAFLLETARRHLEAEEPRLIDAWVVALKALALAPRHAGHVLWLFYPNAHSVVRNVVSGANQRMGH